MSLSIFPKEMMDSSSFSLESIAAKLTYFHLQIQQIHWQTTSHAEHTALNLYDEVFDFKDDVIEKLMGYMGRRVKAYKVEPIVDGASSQTVVKELVDYTYKLYEWAGEQHYCDIENLAQDLSGKAAKTLYLLTQS